MQVAEQPLAPAQKVRENFVLEGRFHVRRNLFQGLGFEQVHAGVDGVAEHLAPARLLTKALHASAFVRYHDPEAGWVQDAYEGDCGRGGVPMVKAGHGLQVDVGNDVSGQHEETLAKQVQCLANGAGRAVVELGLGVADRKTETGAVAKCVADDFGAVEEQHHNLLDPVSAEVIQQVGQCGPIYDRHHRFGQVRGEGAQPRAEAAGQDGGYAREINRSGQLLRHRGLNE